LIISTTVLSHLKTHFQSQKGSPPAQSRQIIMALVRRGLNTTSSTITCEKICKESTLNDENASKHQRTQEAREKKTSKKILDLTTMGGQWPDNEKRSRLPLSSLE